MRATAQQGPFCHCKACHAPLNSMLIEDVIKKRIQYAEASIRDKIEDRELLGNDYKGPTKGQQRHLDALRKQAENDYYGAYEELCPKCLNAALNPPEKDGRQMDGLFWDYRVEEVMDEYYATLECEEDTGDLPW